MQAKLESMVHVRESQEDSDWNLKERKILEIID